MAARVALPESKLRARRRRRRTILAGFMCLVLLGVVGGLVWLAHASFLTISTISVRGLQTLSSTTVIAYADARLEGSYVFVLPKRNIFLYPKTEIRDALLTQFPILKNVDVHAQNFHSIEVVVVERQPRALWCGVSAGERPCEFMDDSGVVYASAPEFSSPIYVSYYGVAEGSRLPRTYLTPPEFESLTALVDAIAQKEMLAVKGVRVDGNRDGHVMFENEFEFMFSLHDDSGDVFERYTLARTAEPFKSHALSEFLYLDLRFGDKLYYKLKTE